MNNVIRNFQSNLETYIQVTSTYNNFNQKLQPQKFLKNSKSKTLKFTRKKILVRFNHIKKTLTKN